MVNRQSMFNNAYIIMVNNSNNNGDMGGFQEVMGDPQVTIGSNTKMVIHDLDDLEVPPWIGNLHLAFGNLAMVNGPL